MSQNTWPVTRLTDKQSDMEAIEKSMDSKEKDGAKARENAAYVPNNH